MTVRDAIQSVLSQYETGLTCQEITTQILKNNLYHFNTSDPKAIVRQELRRHCEGLDFPSAHPSKVFRIVSGERQEAIYSLLTSSTKGNVTINAAPSPITTIDDDSDLLPEEVIQKYYEIHKASIKAQRLDNILSNAPEFFEALVVKLLLSLGYGYDTEAGKVVGKSHDGGIDGIINEDKLGLDKIYIQAKRYKPSQKIGSKEVQAFVGAMKSVKKGVYITTSSFTHSAITFINTQQEKNISLIDGNTLTELMVRCRVGIKFLHAYDTYEIDSDFFETT